MPTTVNTDALTAATRRCLAHAAKVPEGEDYFVKSSISSVRFNLESLKGRVNGLIAKTAEFVTQSGDATADWRVTEDALETIFAAVDGILVESSRKRPRLNEPVPVDPLLDSGAAEQEELTAMTVDNSLSVFYPPALTVKPCAIVPLEDSQVTAQYHVYAPEIKYWLESETASIPNISTLPVPQLPKAMYQTDLVYVNDTESLDCMIAHLNEQRSIAIDVEHHNTHSYRGFTCLIQVSSRQVDFIIDPFPLWHQLHRLNEVTANPEIVKVFHAADMDIIWLQRDFGIYVVNIFDTSQAARSIDIPGGRGLANLLNFYCDVIADKQYQLADWRLRPISPEMLNYARCDTHYLLYMMDRMTRVLLTQGGLPDSEVPTVYGKKMLASVIEASAQTSMKVYKEGPSDFRAAASKLIANAGVKMDVKQSAILRGILQWRDALARQINKSTGFVIGNKACLSLATSNSTTPQQLASRTYSPLVNRNAAQLFDIIQQAISEDTGDLMDVAEAAPVQEERPAKRMRLSEGIFGIARQAVRLVKIENTEVSTQSDLSSVIGSKSQHASSGHLKVMDEVNEELVNAPISQ